MNQQQRDAYIQMREEEVYGRREPTMETVGLPALSRTGEEIGSRADAAYERAQASERRHRQETEASLIKLGLWALGWFCVMCLCKQAALALAPESPDLLTYVFGAVVTAVMLLVTFWRAAWSLMWCVIWIVIGLAIIKGAFLIVFAL